MKTAPEQCVAAPRPIPRRRRVRDHLVTAVRLGVCGRDLERPVETRKQLGTGGDRREVSTCCQSTLRAAWYAFCRAVYSTSDSTVRPSAATAAVVRRLTLAAHWLHHCRELRIIALPGNSHAPFLYVNACRWTFSGRN